MAKDYSGWAWASWLVAMLLLLPLWALSDEENKIFWVLCFILEISLLILFFYLLSISKKAQEEKKEEKIMREEYLKEKARLQARKKLKSA